MPIAWPSGAIRKWFRWACSTRGGVEDIRHAATTENVDRT
jgi:hypothetical protein